MAGTVLVAGLTTPERDYALAKITLAVIGVEGSWPPRRCPPTPQRVRPAA